ncbi:MAG: hypothetical protein ABI357_04705 [Granulicella sp.]
MRRFSTLIPVVIIGLFMFARSVKAAQSYAPPLHTGDVFPQISGETLTSKSLTLPATAVDKAAVLVFSFTRKAGQDAHSWNEHLFKDFPNAIPIYGVIELESAPKLFRGMAIAGIKSSMPLSEQDRNIVLYQNEKLWKRRLAVSNESRAYVVFLGSDAHIEWMNSGAFTDAEYARLKSHISGLLQSHP